MNNDDVIDRNKDIELTTDELCDLLEAMDFKINYKKKTMKRKCNRKKPKSEKNNSCNNSTRKASHLFLWIKCQ